MDGEKDSGERGRRWVRRGVLLLAFASGVGVTLIARPALVAAAGGMGCHGHWGRGNTQAMREHAQVSVKWALRDVGASEEQQQKVSAIVTEALDDLHRLHEQHAGLHQSLVAALGAEKVSREDLEGIRKSAMEAADAASQRLVKAVADAADVLTPEQRQALLAHARQHRH